ncbi:MAG TPA: enoyl-CoA hydratase/isomerase family protein [Acidimicrobiales bacterium]|nr:enoyl-CoA hydratase/isomerase family protein [Acidimicrobiales bacterium]
MATTPLVLIERHALGRKSVVAGLVRLNQPHQLNPIDGRVLEQLDAAVTELVNDRRVRAILITGAGRAFSAGGDLKRYVTLQRDPVRFPQFVRELHRVFGRLRSLPVPVVALVNGVTAAGGLELVLNCDFAIAGASARIGDGHLNFGQMGGGGVLTLLPRAIGRARATELMLSGRFLDADEAVEWGLASRVVADEDLLGAGLDFAGQVAEKSPLAVANAKQVLHDVWSDNGSVAAGLDYELARNAYYCLTSFDAPEGLAAFAEKRRPRFRGR